jgi:hypothetical protein
MNGDRWKLPSGNEGIEVAATRDTLQIAVIKPGWPFPAPPVTVVRSLCTKMPSRYLGGQVPQEDARW